ncbi:MAG: FtsQ-type POTRA domain-containing protein [Candidatus Marinimicrobia bacterium]|nr:FtsQ-type POTRA domain-containing protein [Candidatus Neomarinimicrobiota bacterium]
MHKYLQICKDYAFITLNSILLVALLYGSVLYAQHINLFSQEKVVVLGNKYVTENIILDALHIGTQKSIFSYDLGELQDNVESIEFVKSVKVSRILPSTLMIQVMERSPVILVLLEDENYFFDAEQTPLLANKEAINFFPVPIMTITNDDPIQLGDFELRKALRFVNKSREIHNELYENLSEVRYKNNNLSLITDDRTKIDLGNNETLYKINILKEFQNTVQDKRSLNDYAYIDLKIDKQIIVRER